MAKAVEGEDTRRTIDPVVVVEPPPSALADLGASDHLQIPQEVVEEEVIRHEELLVEPTKVVTIVKLERAGTITEYRKVLHKWGGTFYFKNGEPCSQLAYDSEARSEQLAGATPGGR